MHFSFSASQIFVFVNKYGVPFSESELSPYTNSDVCNVIVHSFAVVVFFSYLRIAAVAAKCKINK